MQMLRYLTPRVEGIVTATRGNHGQSIALAAAKVGIAAIIVVPQDVTERKQVAEALRDSEERFRSLAANSAAKSAGRKVVRRSSLTPRSNAALSHDRSPSWSSISTR